MKVPTLPQWELKNYTKEEHCLAKAIYFETYQKPEEAKLDVAWVLLNRQGDLRFPAYMCEIIQQTGQFPWTRRTITDMKEYLSALGVSYRMLSRLEWNDPTKGAQYFASKEDGWFYSMIAKGHLVLTHSRHGHRFYRWDDKKKHYE